MATDYRERRERADVVEEMALALYDHFNPASAETIRVGKSVCLQMAERALRFFETRNKTTL